MFDVQAVSRDVVVELDRWQVPGAEVVTVQDGSVRLAQGFGTRDNTRVLPVTAATLFQHGSTGKAFTSALVATLVDDGLLEWDRPIRDYWPGFQLFDDARTGQVTVADLLSHRSGIARHEWVWLANPSLTRAELVARMRHLPAAGDLRDAMRYSNLGYAAVGQLIGEVTGSDWESQLRGRLLEPAGMTRTLTSVAAATADADHALPHRERGGVLSPIAFRVMDNVAPAGQVFSCAHDLGRWLQLQLGVAPVGSSQVVSRAALAETHRIHVRVEAPIAPGVQALGYALGWVVATWHGRRLLWHNGEVDGFRTEIMLLPDDGIAVAACVNLAPSGLPGALTRHLAEQLLGLEPEPLTAQPASTEQEPAPEPQTEESSRSTHDDIGPSRALRDLAGTYEHPGYGRLAVSVTDVNQLAVTLGELVMAPAHQHGDAWELDYEPLDESVPLSFDTTHGGPIDEAVLALEDEVAPIRFRRSQSTHSPEGREPLVPSDRPSKHSPEHWQRRLDALLGEVKAPGAVLAIMHGAEVSEFAAGVANVGTGAAVTTDTLFPIASITKVFTATLAMQLVDEGELDLDRPVRDYLPAFRVADPQATATLTARHLLTHTSGIGGDKEDTFGRGDDALGRFVADCATLGQIHPPGDTFSYCNSGYNILGHLVSVLRGKTWDEAMRDHLFVPLGMTRSGTLPEDVIWHRLAAGHQTGDDGRAQLLDAWEAERTQGPCGGVVTSAGQLLNFVAMHLADGVGHDLTRVLSAASTTAMTAPQLALPNPYDGETHWGLGWEITQHTGQPRLLGHGGDLLGHHARLLICPARGFAAVLLVNGDGADHIATPLFGEALADLDVALPERPSPAQSPPVVDVAAVAGQYETLAVRATITANGDHLDATFRVIAERIAAMLPEGQREHRARLVPVTSSLFLTRDDDEGPDEPWTPLVFTESGSHRYLHMGGRAMRRT